MWPVPIVPITNCCGERFAVSPSPQSTKPTLPSASAGWHDSRFENLATQKVRCPVLAELEDRFRTCMAPSIVSTHKQEGTPAPFPRMSQSTINVYDYINTREDT